MTSCVALSQLDGGDQPSFSVSPASSPALPSPAASCDTSDLFQGELASTAADPGARLARIQQDRSILDSVTKEVASLQNLLAQGAAPVLGQLMRRGLYVSATGIYGSGLTNGGDVDSTFGTGLFDFNKSIHVDPNFIFNASAGYALTIGRTVLRPQLYIENLFDKQYLLKGAFFSGASVGRPRSVQFRVNVGL